MKTFVHFLGYSKAEGGIQEIFTDEVFSMGSINLETGEREFDDFEFKVPMCSILKTKPPINEPWVLGKSMSYTIEDGINLIGEELSQGDKIWIENERVEMDRDMVSPGMYDVIRGINGSIPVYHQSDIINEDYGQCITCTLNRVSPIGLIVKVYNSDNEILAYGQVKNLKMNESGFVTVECSNLYTQLDTSLIFKHHSWMYNNGHVALDVMVFNRINEFFALLDMPSLPYMYNIVYERISGVIGGSESWYSADKIKDYIEQILHINNSFITFENGRYVVKDFSRPIGTENHTKITIANDLIRNGGSLDVELAVPVSSVTLSNEVLGKPITKWNNDSNFTNYYTNAKKISINLDAMTIPADDAHVVTTLKNIAAYKLFALNSISEYLTFDADKYTKPFVVGSYYKILDIYKYSMFYDGINDNVYFCIGVDESSVKLVRTNFNNTLLVAPSLLVKKTDTSKYTVVDIDYMGDYLYFSGQNRIDVVRNPETTELVWEATDGVCITNVNSGLYFGTITSLTSDTFTLNIDPGSVGDYFYITIEKWNNGSIKDKNGVYFYDNAIGVL